MFLSHHHLFSFVYLSCISHTLPSLGQAWYDRTSCLPVPLSRSYPSTFCTVAGFDVVAAHPRHLAQPLFHHIPLVLLVALTSVLFRDAI
ncbi:hypothetical protein SCLCIDRAFT_1020698 [Scleroderma citrinum Foug A]|uniref:Secreted protein n=1 Tax=Scleroderma citrinum Foug A TaxID=1036808 RepID=A0A0C2ZC52_9AGAM|nr:hypothetical protein SCLCIDRAFT_1020698 [Scleroderma citrinum Foug A]